MKHIRCCSKITTLCILILFLLVTNGYSKYPEKPWQGKARYDGITWEDSIRKGDNLGRVNFWVDTDSYTPEKSWPLIVVFHGSSGGNYPNKWDDYISKYVQHPDAKNYIWIQLNERYNQPDWNYGYVFKPNVIDNIDSIRYISELFNIDQKRIYLWGRSGGSTGVLTTSYTMPKAFTAYIPVSGLQNYYTASGSQSDAVPVPDDLGGIDYLDIYGKNDYRIQSGYVSAAERESAGAFVQFEVIPGLGHWLPVNYFMPLIRPFMDSRMSDNATNWDNLRQWIVENYQFWGGYGNIWDPENPKPANRSIPSAPTELTVTYYSDGNISFSWKDNSVNESGFRIYRSADGENFKSVVTLDANVTEFESRDILKGKHINKDYISGESYYYFVTAVNSGGESSRSEIVSVLAPNGDPLPPLPGSNPKPPPALGEIIFDTGDASTSSTGTWSLSAGPNYYGNQSLYSTKAGATYTYQASVNGNYEISLWWTTRSSRDTSVPVRIYDGNTILDTVWVNQQQDGGQWNFIGTYNFGGTGRVVITSESTIYSTCADAAMFTPLDSPPPPPPGSIINLFLNGSFEYDSDGNNNPDNWIIAQPVELDFTESVDGQYSAKIESTEVINNISSQYVDLDPYTTYTLSAWIKTENVTSEGAQVYPYDYGGVIDQSKWIRVKQTTDWTYYSMQFTTGADPSKARMNFRLKDATGTAWFDDINLVEGGS